jgi:DNA-binding CsgD family transcriptional regulator
MSLADDVARLVPLIYQAGVDPAAWRGLLGGMVELFGGHCGSFIARRPDGSGARTVEIGFDPAALEQFFGHFAGCNVLLQRGIGNAAGTIVTDQDVLPKPEFRRTEYYNDFLMRQEDTNALLTGFLWRDSGRFVVFNCNRSPRCPEFDAADKALLRGLLPHLARAIDIALRLGTLEGRAANAGTLGEGSAHGVLVLDANGAVRFANPTGERLLAERDGLDAGLDGLRAATPDLTAALAAAITRAASGVYGGAVTRARPRRGRPLYVLTSPLPEETLWLQPGRRRVLVLLRDPAERPALGEGQLRALFQLTAAEARLALRLYAGDDLATAAAALGISRHTARTHLNAVLDKTDSDRQAALIHRLSMVAELAARQPGTA